MLRLRAAHPSAGRSERGVSTASLFEPTRPHPFPADAEIVTRDGKPHVRLRVQGKTVHYPLTEDGVRYLRPSPKWAADVVHADGRRKRVRFSPNKTAAEAMLAALLRQIEGERTGIIDHTAGARRKPVAAHLAEWEASLAANGRTADYVALKLARVREAAEACGWVMLGDLTADRLERHLAELRSRRPALPPLPDGIAEFTLTEATDLLGGVTRQTVGEAVRRFGLAATGNGKARRLPRATVEALRGVKLRGRAMATTNHILAACRQFARWLSDHGRLGRNPFDRLRPMNARLDVRRRRGEFSADELGRLLAVAIADPGTVRGLLGIDRAVCTRWPPRPGSGSPSWPVCRPSRSSWLAIRRL